MSPKNDSLRRGKTSIVREPQASLENTADKWAEMRNNRNVDEWLDEVRIWDNEDLERFEGFLSFMASQNFVERTVETTRKIKELTHMLSTVPELLTRTVGVGLLSEEAFQNLQKAVVIRDSEIASLYGFESLKERRNYCLSSAQIISELVFPKNGKRNTSSLITLIEKCIDICPDLFEILYSEHEDVIDEHIKRGNSQAIFSKLGEVFKERDKLQIWLFSIMIQNSRPTTKNQIDELVREMKHTNTYTGQNEYLS